MRCPKCSPYWNTPPALCITWPNPLRWRVLRQGSRGTTPTSVGYPALWRRLNGRFLGPSYRLNPAPSSAPSPRCRQAPTPRRCGHRVWCPAARTRATRFGCQKRKTLECLCCRPARWLSHLQGKRHIAFAPLGKCPRCAAICPPAKQLRPKSRPILHA